MLSECVLSENFFFGFGNDKYISKPYERGKEFDFIRVPLVLFIIFRSISIVKEVIDYF